MPLLFDDCDDVFFPKDQQFFPVYFDGLARIFAEQYALADLQIRLDASTVVVAFSWTDREHFALIGFFRGAFRDDKTGCGLGFLIYAFDDDAVVQRAQAHGMNSVKRLDNRSSCDEVAG